jgi:hypothetical protein
VAGCQTLFAPKGPPSDPLLLVKKPLEVKPQAGPPVTLVYSEPALPADPWAKHNAPDFATHPPRRIPATLTNRVIHPDLREAGPERTEPR